MRVLRLLSHLLWMLGLLACFVSVFVGPMVPYQDPTPAMRAEEARQEHLSTQFFETGLGLFGGGLALVVTLALVRRLSTRRPDPGGTS